MEEKNENLLTERDYGFEILNIIRGGHSNDKIKELLEEYHGKDIARIFEELTADERERLFEMLGIYMMSDVVSYLDGAGEYRIFSTIVLPSIYK